MVDPQTLFATIGGLFDVDDGSLPEIRLSGMSPDDTPRLYTRLRALAAEIREGARFRDRRVARDAGVDSVPNAAALVAAGDAEPFHFILVSPQVGGVTLPDLGVFVFRDEIALDYQMGPAWGPSEVTAFLGLLDALARSAPGSRLELDETATTDERERFAASVALYRRQRGAV